MIRVVAFILVSLLVIACSGDDDADEPDAATRVPSVSTPRPGSTPPPDTTAVPTVSIDSFDTLFQLRGAYRTPERTDVTTVLELPQRPKPQFAEWDGVSVVIYDTETHEAHDFGPGSLALPAFSKDHFVYTSAGRDIFVVDLATFEKRFLARGLLAYFLGNHYVVINPGDNNFYAMNVNTGTRVEMWEIRDPLLNSMTSQRWGGAFRAKWIDGLYAIRLVENPQAVCELSGAEQRSCIASASSKWLVENIWTGEIIMALEANRVEPAGFGHIVIATTPLCNEAKWITECPTLLTKLEAQNATTGSRVAVGGTTNIFLVDLATGEATFVATATYNPLTGSWPMSWPLVADENYVIWTESYCGEPRGLTRIYDRATGQITELNVSDWLTLSDGRLGFGEQGATSVIDPVTLEYLAVLPELSGVSWSPDLKYAAVGQALGRAGVCE